MEDDNESDETELDEKITAQEDRKGNEIISPSSSSIGQENTAGIETGDEWWRDPFRLFESESSQKQLSKQQDLDTETTKMELTQPEEVATQVPAVISGELGPSKNEEISLTDGESTVTELDLDASTITNEVKVDVTAKDYDDRLDLPEATTSTTQIALQPLATKQVPILKNISPRTFTLPIMIPLALSKFQSATIPVTKYLFVIVVAQVLWSYVKDVPQVVQRWANTNSTARKDVIQDQEEGQESLSGDLNLEEIEALRRLGFHQNKLHVEKNKLDVENEVGQDEDGAQAEDQTEGETGSQKNGFLQWLMRRRQGNVSKRELKEEISRLKRRAQIAESEIETVQQEWALCVQQLEEANSKELRLLSANKYLQERLRDSQKEMEGVLKRERQKSNQEMARIREAMVEVLDRERKLIRDHMLSASKEVRAAMLAAEEETYASLSK